MVSVRSLPVARAAMEEWGYHQNDYCDCGDVERAQRRKVLVDWYLTKMGTKIERGTNEDRMDNES